MFEEYEKRLQNKNKEMTVANEFLGWDTTHKGSDPRPIGYDSKEDSLPVNLGM